MPPLRPAPARGVARIRVTAREMAFAVRRRSLASEPLVLLLLVGVVIGVSIGTALRPTVVPPTVVDLAVVVGGLLLRPRYLQLLVWVTLAMTAFVLANVGLGDYRSGNLAVLALFIAIGYWMSSSRARLGLQGLRGESMLVDLRDRISAQGEMPGLPEGWCSEVVLRSAGGSKFGGDFLVATRRRVEDVLEVALVDVSGKGTDAGTRALLLSGALSGLLGEVPPEDFLAAANSYLLRQGWDEGFATAIHLVLSLQTGEYLVESAGHPPAAHFDAGSGRWRITEAEGPMLGLLEKVSFSGERGVLRRGDALLLYTDGLVEVPGRDLDVGIDRLLGEAERLIPRGFGGGAVRLVRALPEVNDDRALLMIWRP